MKTPLPNRITLAELPFMLQALPETILAKDLPGKMATHANARRRCGLRRASPDLLLSMTLVWFLGNSLPAGEMYHPGDLTPGGVPAQSIITSTIITPTNASLCWYGMQGWYSVETATNILGPWTSVGRGAASDYAWCMTVPNTNGPTAMFRLNQNNAFVGSGGCAGCHGDKYSTYLGTGHSWAYNDITNLSGADFTNQLVYHTVGYGQPTGFVDLNSTPRLANVGCENCHGPAGWHKYSDHDLVRPAVTVAAEVCGGCHNANLGDPMYEDWTNSAHATVTPHVANYFRTTPPLQPNCGPCHSGAVRVGLLKNYEDTLAGITNYLTLATANDAATYGTTCATCHDPHGTDNPAEVRNPVSSTNFFTYFNSAPTTNVYYTNFMGVVTTNTYYLNTAFVSQYDPTIQVCAQCHNSRGARWQDTSRPPHHSPQYNILIGAVQTNYLNGVNSMPGIYGQNPDGCAACHIVPVDAEGYTGHSFTPRLEGLVNNGWYADTASAAADVANIQTATTNYISTLVGMLNNWAVTKAPASLTNSGPYAWEYSSAGELCNPTGTNTWINPYGTNAVIAGPSTPGQAAIPDLIKQARFDLYIVFHDYSLGVHNTNYVQYLLNDSSNKVWQASQ